MLNNRVKFLSALYLSLCLTACGFEKTVKITSEKNEISTLAPSTTLYGISHEDFQEWKDDVIAFENTPMEKVALISAINNLSMYVSDTEYYSQNAPFNFDEALQALDAKKELQVRELQNEINWLKGTLERNETDLETFDRILKENGEAIQQNEQAFTALRQQFIDQFKEHATVSNFERRVNEGEYVDIEKFPASGEDCDTLDAERRDTRAIKYGRVYAEATYAIDVYCPYVDLAFMDSKESLAFVDTMSNEKRKILTDLATVYFLKHHHFWLVPHRRYTESKTMGLKEKSLRFRDDTQLKLFSLETAQNNLKTRTEALMEQELMSELSQFIGRFLKQYQQTHLFAIAEEISVFQPDGFLVTDKQYDAYFLGLEPSEDGQRYVVPARGRHPVINLDNAFPSQKMMDVSFQR